MRIIEPELRNEAACSKHHLEITSVQADNLSRKFPLQSSPHHTNYINIALTNQLDAP